MAEKRSNRKLLLNIIFPAFLTLAIFITVFFFIILPYYELSLMNRKKEMIRELTNSAWSILNNYHQEQKEGLLNEEQAMYMAVDAVGNLRYGEDLKDYFWITDMQPVMIVHPYRSDLISKNLAAYKDPLGKKVFVECVDVVKSSGEGYVNYMWQWKDDSIHIVPKLSFVKGFSPWNWVIGTGIYLEDMYQEIGYLKKKLIYISLFIIVIISLILIYIILQNLRLESKKQDALIKLKKSKEKYKTLVEASTEGVIMLLDHKVSYVNSLACKLLEYSEQELKDMPYSSLFIENNHDVFNGFFEADVSTKEQKNINLETDLKKKNGEIIHVQLSASSIIFDKKKGCLLTLKDISKYEQTKRELDHQVERFKLMTDQVNIGVFRSTLGRRGNFVEINDYALQLLGYKRDEISKLNILDVFSEKENKKEIIKDLFDDGEVIDKLVRLKTKENSVVMVKASLFISEDKDNKQRFCDGIIQDISQQLKKQKESDQLVEDLQLANMFLNQAVKTLEMPVSRCFLDDSIKKVVQKMARNNSEVILVQSRDGIPVGLFSDSDLRERVVVENINFDQAIHKVMVAPLVTISEKQMLFEAILKMRAKEVKYICMINARSEVTGLLSMEDLANAQHHSQTMLSHRIRAAETKEELKDCYHQLAPLVKALMESGMKVHKVTSLISNVSDEITNKVIQLCMDEIGDAPVKFSFVALGSVGRKEQTLATDQDNAFIFEDVSEEKFSDVQAYFLNLGRNINHWLDFIGYTFCKGEVMVRNPKWCQPLSVWKKYFNQWIGSSTPQSLIDTCIFYDMRFLNGDKLIADNLLQHISEIKNNKAIFLYHSAQTVLSLKPPISFFGNFIVESGDEHKSSFDIKQVITILTGLLRVYALKNCLTVVNSLERLQSLVETGKFTDADQNGFSDAYRYLMNLRIKHQIDLLQNGQAPDNYINPRMISEIERSILKKIFSKITDFQSKMGFDFKGTL
ncbi:MAG: cache domain-containing protein [Bacteroidales bacterium]|nr:cache domain-containing protein [Bacteroidales bacterium]